MQWKPYILAWAVALCASLHAAETNSITTRDGVTYTNAIITRVQPNGLVIEYAPSPGAIGIAKLKFSNLPDALQTKYGYDPTNAQIFERNQLSGHRSWVAQREEAKQAAERELEIRRTLQEITESVLAEQQRMEAAKKAQEEKERAANAAAKAEAKRLADAQALRDWWDYGLKANLLRDLTPKPKE